VLSAVSACRRQSASCTCTQARRTPRSLLGSGPTRVLIRDRIEGEPDIGERGDVLEENFRDVNIQEVVHD
jgi:hypothetical protein